MSKKIPAICCLTLAALGIDAASQIEPTFPVQPIAHLWERLSIDLADYRERLNDWVPQSANLVFVNAGGAAPRVFVRPAISGTLLAFDLHRNDLGVAEFQIVPELVGPHDIQQMLSRDLDADGIDELILIREGGVVDIHGQADRDLQSPLATLHASPSIADIVVLPSGFVTLHENSTMEWHRMRAGWRFLTSQRHLMRNGEPIHIQAVVADPSQSGASVLLFTDAGAYRMNSDGHAHRLQGYVAEESAVVVNAQLWSRSADGYRYGQQDELLVQERLYDDNRFHVSTRVTTFLVNRRQLQAQSSIVIANDAVHVCPIDVNQDGWTDLASMRCLNDGQRPWNAVLGSAQGFTAQQPVAVNCAQVLRSAITHRLPTLELPITTREEVSGSYSLQPVPAYAADGVTSEMVEKLCLMLANMDGLGQALVASGNAPKGAQLRTIVKDLKKLKSEGKLNIRCFSDNTLGETNKATGEVSISKGLFSNLEALCGPESAETWQLIRILIHEGLHTQCVGDQDGHPQVQVETICLLNAIAALNVDNDGNVVPMPPGFYIAKANEKMYILRTEQILQFLDAVCFITGNGQVLEEAVRQSLERVFSLCQVPFDASQMVSSNTVNANGSITASASFNGVTLTITWTPNSCKVDLVYCGVGITEEL